MQQETVDLSRIVSRFGMSHLFPVSCPSPLVMCWSVFCQEWRLVDDAKFVGSSAGSLIALALALGLDFERIRNFQLGCVDRTHGSISGAFKLKQYVDEIMDDMLPDDAYTKVGDRVEVCLRQAVSLCSCGDFHVVPASYAYPPRES